MAWTLPTTRATGDLVTASIWNTDLVNNLKALKTFVTEVEFTSDVTTTATTEGTAATVVSAGAVTYLAMPTTIEFFAPAHDRDTSTHGIFTLFDGATVLGIIARGQIGTQAIGGRRNLTPTAASHTYLVKVHGSGAGTSRVYAGSGGSGAHLPGFIRVTQTGVA